MSHQTRREPVTHTRIICDEEGCQFRGSETRQGVCHSTEGDVCDFAKLDRLEAETLESLDELRADHGDEYVAVLESYYVCATMNWSMTLDECVRLRRDNALLRKALQDGRK